MQKTGVIVGLIWLFASILLPSFAGFFIYQNWRPFWISVVCMVLLGFIDIALNLSYYIINSCNHSIYGCDLNFFVPVGVAIMILIAISTIIIILKDWHEKTTILKEQELKEQQLTQL